MKNALLHKAIATALLGAIIAACGGGGGGTVDEGGIGGSGLSQGVITGFGSVWVNGVEFDTDASTISVNGDAAATQSVLRLGMIVTVTGTINADGVSGTATHVSYGRNLEGPVDSIVSASELVVAGQVVLIDSATQLSGIANIAALVAGNVVQVSGFRDANGAWRATYLALTAESFVDGATEVEVKGTIAGLAGAAFNIGALSIDASGVDVSALSNGAYVKVEGVRFGNGGELIAQQVELESSGLGVEDAEAVELQGLVTAVNSASEFVLGAQTVRIGADTQFDGGVAADIRVGLRLEVEGSLAGGVLTPDDISFEDDVELEADVSAISIGAGTLTLAGLGLEVHVDDALAEFEGTTGLAALGAGDHVVLRGRATANGVEASTIALVDASDAVVLRGAIESVGGSTLTVLGLDIDVSAIADGGAVVIGQARVGDAVEVEGALVGSAVVWEAIELDD